jgi:hypothetical protein
MPMIDVYAAAGTFTDKHQLATDLAVTLMTIEEVPDIPMSARTRPRSSTSCPQATSRTSTASPATFGCRC